MGDRNFRDRDFLSTEEGFMFCVVGPYHPADRVISYLKYSPNQAGDWRRGEDRFKRVMRVYTISNLLETFDLLRNKAPQYLYYSTTYDVELTAVPRENVVTHFKPEEKLVGLIEGDQLDSLQGKVVDFVSLLSRLSGVPISAFGVTGSVLLDIHTPSFSDMDVTVYGVANSFAVKRALTELRWGSESNIKRFNEEKLAEWAASKMQNHPLNLAEAMRIYKRKWNMGTFDRTFFSVHPVKLEGELAEEYGDKMFIPDGVVTICAVVDDDRDSIFLPATYKVREVKMEEELQTRIEEVVTYEGIYDSLATKGEVIEARGKLEHVIDRVANKMYDRVLVGSLEGKGREFIKPRD